MESKSLMVIDPSMEIPEIESFNSISIQSPIQTTYHLPAIHSPDSMYSNFEETSAIILMGSAASVHDSFQWIKDIQIIIEKAIKRKIPILGICFGHQFIAHIFGGVVDYLWEKSKKKGVRKVKIFENNLLIPKTETLLIYSHQEGVIKCPPNFQISASSDTVEIEGLVHKNLPIWTFQPHVESSKEFASRLGISSQQFTKTLNCSSLILGSFLNKLKNS
tara:strand:- start:212 stop:868 length:657 start_codon:yes stop_codon:yes gene_type:complete